MANAGAHRVLPTPGLSAHGSDTVRDVADSRFQQKCSECQEHMRHVQYM